MSDDALDLPNPVDPLVEEFLARRRAGEALSVTSFCAAHAEHEAALRELLPMLVALEDHKRDRSSSGSGLRRAQVPQLERLGDFKIVRELGRGGMGVVFEAVQESLGRKVALKVLPQSALLTGNQLERFVREAQIAAQLHHSNIVPVYGSGESDGYHWYAMQFVVGVSLDRWQTEQRRAPPVGVGAWRARANFVARLGQQAAGALHWAHLQGTLHRDIKPGNLLLEQNDHLWVTDFGLAKALEQDGLTRSGDVLGTLQYMAPEQFAGQYDVRSEVYALGVTLYELLTLQPAFAGSSRSELMERIRSQRPESLRKLCPELPQDLVVVVEKAMAREPGDRYPDAGALAADLQAFADDRPVAARRLSRRAQLWRWCRRNRGMAALAASTLLAVVAAAVTGWVAYGIADVARVDAAAALQREAQQSQRNDANVKLMLAGLSDVFDALIGRDPTLLFEVDPETGEQTVITRQVVDPRSIRALEDMLRLYHDFAAQNADDQQLRFETARAHRRVGAIHVRLGKPANLASAANAYQQALQLLAAITDRDVTREKVAVLADLGRLEQRNRDLPAASRHLLAALAELEQVDGPAPLWARFERAQDHYLLAQLADGSGLPRGPGGPPGPGSGERREMGRVLQTSQRHLTLALAAVAELLTAEPQNVEFRALQARCLLLTGRLAGRRGERPRDPADEAQRERGLAILRELVAYHPEAEHLRFSLAEGLLGSRGPRGRRDEPPRRDEPSRRAVDPAELALEFEHLREAKAHASLLVEQQPLLDEYQGLALRTALQLGRALREQALRAEPAEAMLLRQQAQAELDTAVRIGSRLLAGEGAGNVRFVRDVADARRLRINLFAAEADWGAVADELDAIADLFEQQAALAAAAGQPAGPFPGGLVEGREFAHAMEMAQWIGRSEVVDRLRKLRDQWQALDGRRPR